MNEFQPVPTRIEENPVKIFTDGSAEPNPGPGGWAAIILLADSTPVTLRGSAGRTTNNRMEFSAALAAMQWMIREGKKSAVIHSDSMYLVNTFRSWVWSWERRGWPPEKKNLDLIRPGHELQKRLAVTWKWVRGHAGHEWNELADEEASAARMGQIECGFSLCALY